MGSPLLSSLGKVYLCDGSSLVVNLWRPAARRLANTARPATELIRLRKPCLFVRLRLLGWYVRFMAEGLACFPHTTLAGGAANVGLFRYLPNGLQTSFNGAQTADDQGHTPPHVLLNAQ
jgi:hypothetical protein